MKDIILRDAKMCAYVAGNVEHFKYLMKRLGYIFKKDAWMEVQAPRFLCISPIHFTQPNYMLKTRKQSQDIATVVGDVVIL